MGYVYRIDVLPGYTYHVLALYLYCMSCCYIGVNLLVGTENGLYLLDRSGNGKGRNSCYSLTVEKN